MHCKSPFCICIPNNPNLKTAAKAWTYAGGAHHIRYRQNISMDSLQEFAKKMDVEFLLIGDKTDLYRFKQELRRNEAAFMFNKGFN